MNRIAIGISVYNDSEYLDMLLQSIRWYTYIEEGYDLIVCDDGSTDEHIKAIRKVCEDYGATLLEHEQNLGIPATWNHLILAMKQDVEICVLLNNDLLVVPQWLDVAIHFLDSNRDNPHVGTCYWNPHNRWPKGAMKSILPNLGHTTYSSCDTVSGADLGFDQAMPYMEMREGHAQGLGKVMCPCGCCFAFRRIIYNIAGGFDERFTSFHEESHFGTTLALHGRASFGFPYPRPYHTHGACFAVNHELQSGKRMVESRALYRHIWKVPEDISDHKYFEHVHERLMPKIPKTKYKYLRPDYDRSPVSISLVGGEIISMPELVEFEEEF